MSFCYFRGDIIEASKVSVPADNIGLQRGFGIFDFFKAKDGQPIFLEDYLNRFDASQQILNLSRKISKKEIRDAVAALQAKNGFNDSTFKLMLLGDGTDQSEVLSPFFYILNNRITSPQPEYSNLISYEYVRENPLVKSISYFNSYALHQQKIKAGAIDVLYHFNGKVSEASRSNLFIVKDGVLKTPESDLLQGITRIHVMKVAKALLEVKIDDFSIEEVLSADEVFITSTLKEIMPIVALDGKTIGNGKVGQITSKLKEDFHTYILQGLRSQRSPVR